MTWQHYLKDTRDELLPRYVELCEDVSIRLEELGMVQAQEKELRREGFLHSEATTVSGREADASLRAAVVTAEGIKLRSQLDSVREERDLVRYVLDAVVKE